MSDRKQIFWFVALLSALVVLPFLGETLFYSKGEPREAIVAVSILQNGDWVLPLNYGTDIPYKPLFLYWMIAGLSWLFGGEVTEFTSRLPSALAFLAMQLCFFNFVARRRGNQTVLLTALLLLTSFEVHRAAVACRLDMLQVSFIVMSLCLLFRWDEKGCCGVPWLAVLLMACGTLTKGPVGFLLPCGCMGAYQLLRGRNFWKAFFSLLGIGLLSCLPLFVWVYAAYIQGGDDFLNLMLEENTGRFAGTMSYESHENPIWYNFLTLIWGWIPWTLVLLISLFSLRRYKIQGTRYKVSYLVSRISYLRNQSPFKLFTWTVILLIFIFYCIPKSKRSVYLLPIYPFMAVLIAEYLLAWVQRGAKLLKLCAVIFASLSLLLTLTFIAVRCAWVPYDIFGTGRHAAENLSYMLALELTWIPIPQLLLIALPVIAALCLFRMLRQDTRYKIQDTRYKTQEDEREKHKTCISYLQNLYLLYGIAGCMLCLFVALDGFYQPTVLAVKSDKQLAEQVCGYVPEGAVYSYSRISFYGVNFYLGDRMRHIEAERPDEGYLLVPEKEEEAMLQELGTTYRLEKIFRTDRRSCDQRDYICFYRFHQ